MDFNFISNLQSCYNFINGNPTIVTMVLYTHIPSIIIALSIGLLVLIKNRSLLSKILFVITVLFSIWVLTDLIVWLSTNSTLIMMAWSLFWVTTGMIATFSFYFFYVFLHKKDLSLLKKSILFTPLLPIIFLTPTILNLINFDLINCEAKENIFLFPYYFTLGGLAILGILILLILSWRKIEKTFRREAVLMTVGIESFLIAFYSLSAISSYFNNYNIEFYGLFGMVIFMAFLAYMIVKFKEFNVKMLATQALVWALIILIGSQFLFIQNNTNKILTAVTLVISGWLGLTIIRSVKKEIEAKEALAVANIRLKELDQLKSEFVSLATHQIRAPLSAIKGYLSEVFEGDFGPISKELEKPLQIVFQSTENLVHIVGDFLNISRIEQGKMKYELTPLDLKQVVEDTVKGLKPNLERSKLQLEMNIPNGTYGVYADAGKIREVVGNLIDNSMKYTPHGSIKISLTTNTEKQKVLFAISDTGIGIPAEVLPKLFQKFTRAKGANEVNIIGTGLGLYVAKLMIEGQGGRIWAESPGAGKGSTFYVELPVAHVS